MSAAAIAVFAIAVCGSAAGSGPTCVEGLPNDCAYLEAARTYQTSQSRLSVKELRRLARRGHVGARALLIDIDGDVADERHGPGSTVPGTAELADQGVAAGFEAWGLALMKDPETAQRGFDVVVQAVRRGPRDAVTALGFAIADSQDSSRAERRVAAALIVAGCVMGSDAACHRGSLDAWDPSGPDHDPELAVWLAERALVLGNEWAAPWLGNLLAFGDDVEGGADRAVGLLRPDAEDGSASAMYALAGALLRRDGEGDARLGMTWLRKAVDAGHVDAAHTTLALSLIDPIGMEENGLSSVMIEQASSILKERRPESHAYFAAMSATTWLGAPARFKGADPEPAMSAFDAMRGGEVGAATLLAVLVEDNPGAVRNAPALLAAFEDALCVVGPDGIPPYVRTLRVLGDPTDVMTQASWLFLYREPEAMNADRDSAFVTLRNQVWSALSGAKLIAAEAQGLDRLREILSERPDCALGRQSHRR
jgi:TPR repeat protein